MKHIKKLLAFAIVAVMMLSLCGLGAYADDTGTITVTGTTNGKTYDLFKIFDLTGSDTSDPADGNYDVVAYTLDPDWVNFFLGENAPGAAYLLTTKPEGSNLNSLVYNGTTYYINITDSNVAAFAQAALPYAVKLTPDKSASATGTSLVFTDLALGYYLVYPEGATDIIAPNASLCSLDSTTPNGQVVVKASYPNIEKTGDEANVEIGFTETYTVKGQVPDTSGYETYTYKVTDTMSEGLTFNASVANLTVKFGNTAITVPEEGKATVSFADNGFELVFDMTKYQTYKGQEITIQYSAVVNEKAVVHVTLNTAILSYTTHPGGGLESTPPISVPVYTSRIAVYKYDGDNTEKKLPGAKFVLVKKTTEGEGDDATVTESFYKFTAATQSDPAKVEWVSNVAQATEVETDAQGEASFEGLKDGTYYLRETKAPDGYNKLADDVEVVVTHTTDQTVNQPVGVSQEARVPNKGGAELPATGGIGTTIFYVVGSILVVGAVIVLVTKKRVSQKF